MRRFRGPAPAAHPDPYPIDLDAMLAAHSRTVARATVLRFPAHRTAGNREVVDRAGELWGSRLWRGWHADAS